MDFVYGFLTLAFLRKQRFKFFRRLREVNQIDNNILNFFCYRMRGILCNRIFKTERFYHPILENAKDVPTFRWHRHASLEVVIKAVLFVQLLQSAVLFAGIDDAVDKFQQVLVALAHERPDFTAVERLV